MSADSEQPELVYPFVVVRSSGGPYDDDAYSAGVEFGAITTQLQQAAPNVSEMRHTVRTANLPQLDLAAAASRWVLESEPWESDGDWSFATFRRPWAAGQSLHGDV